MKRLFMSIGILFMGVSFLAAPSYSACTLDPNNGPYATVMKYQTGKTKIVEMWECVSPDAIAQGNGVCFYNILDNQANVQYICISGEFKVIYPVNW